MWGRTTVLAVAAMLLRHEAMGFLFSLPARPVSRAAWSPSTMALSSSAAPVTESSEAIGSTGSKSEAQLKFEKLMESKRNSQWLLLEGLSYSVKESDLRSLFEREGMTVHDVIVPRSPEGTPRAGAGKGTAMVQLGSPAEAERGEAMHGKEVLGRWMAVQRCMPPAECKTVKVVGLPYTMAAEQVGEMFAECGTVESVSVPSARTGLAWVTFTDNQAAMKALDKDGWQVGGRWLDILLQVKYSSGNKKGPAAPASGGGGASSAAPRKPRVRVRNLPYQATTDEIRAVLQDFGVTVADLYMPPYRDDPSRNMGVAYATMAEEGDKQKLLEVQTAAMGERTIFFSDADEKQPRRERNADEEGAYVPTRSSGSKAWKHRVYYGNLPFEMTAEDILTFLEQHDVSEVARVVLPKGKGGTAYLAFYNVEMANKAVELDGSIVEKDGRSRFLRANHMGEGSPRKPAREEDSNEEGQRRGYSDYEDEDDD